MDKILEKFGGYLWDVCESISIEGIPCVDYVFKFENGYGVLLIIEKFYTSRFYDVAIIKFINGGDKLEFVKKIPQRYINGITYNPINEVCEYLQEVKDH